MSVPTMREVVDAFGGAEFVIRRHGIALRFIIMRIEQKHRCLEDGETTYPGLHWIECEAQSTGAPTRVKERKR